MRAAFKGPFVLNSDYDYAKGQAALDAGKADAISFGRPFISNPDLPEAFRERDRAFARRHCYLVRGRGDRLSDLYACSDVRPRDSASSRLP